METLGTVPMRYKTIAALFLLTFLAGCKEPGRELYEAAKRCDGVETERLLSKEALAYRGHNDDSAVHRAAVCRKDFSALKAIIEYEPRAVFFESKRKSTALSSSFGPNDYEKVLYLLDQGSEIPHYEQDEYGSYSLLHRAVVSSPAATIELLIDRGADVTAASFFRAISFSDASVIALLLPRLHPDIINRPDLLDRYPLEGAINHKKADVLLLLLESGARTDIRFINGLTPREHAEARGEQVLADMIKGYEAAAAKKE